MASKPEGTLALRQILAIVTLSLSVALAVVVFIIVYFNNFFPGSPQLSNAKLLLMCALAKMPVRGVDEATTRGDQQEFELQMADTQEDPSDVQDGIENRLESLKCWVKFV